MTVGLELSASALAALRATLVGLDPAVRESVARDWARAAQFEHASIASFSRFSLELLAVGAPPELVEGAHRAALDEIRHARLSFALASVYVGTPLGPGPLPIEPALFTAFELTSAACSTVAEGCVAETLAAVEAEAAEAAAEPAAVKQVLAIIARDEAEHAALAARFVRWAVELGGSETRSAVEAAFRSAIARCHAESASSGVFDAELARHGRLVGPRRKTLRDRALEEVIAPLAREICRPSIM